MAEDAIGGSSQWATLHSGCLGRPMANSGHDRDRYRGNGLARAATIGPSLRNQRTRLSPRKAT